MLIGCEKRRLVKFYRYTSTMIVTSSKLLHCNGHNKQDHEYLYDTFVARNDVLESPWSQTDPRPSFHAILVHANVIR